MHVFFCVSKNVSVSCAYTQGKREQFSGFNRTLDAINNVFRKFSAFHDETGRLNVDGMNIISNDGSNKLNRSRSEERFSRNAETDLVCRLLLEKKKKNICSALILCHLPYRIIYLFYSADGNQQYRTLTFIYVRCKVLFSQ